MPFDIRPLFSLQATPTASIRKVEIKEGSRIVFSRDDVSVPSTWTDTAAEQPARLYFRVIGGKQESSVFSMVDRVVGPITSFASAPLLGSPLVEEASVLEQELRAMVLSQRFAWNTPVWVNVGADLPPGERPQCSACFILSVKDELESIIDLQSQETMLFRRGSGTGSNLSTLRPKGFPLSRGGFSSGPVSFALGYDAWAGVTKSGGSSRRAAKMVCFDVSHPDIMDFVTCKLRAERMKRTLVAAGYDPDFNAEATAWSRYQNANHSVRITQSFLDAVDEDETWQLRWDGKVVREIPAREIWDAIVESAMECGDPGLQFEDEIQAWHTCPAGGPIRASNPCSEYMFLNDSACNLGSLNLMKFWQPPESGHFPLEPSEIGQAVRAAILSMEAIVDLAGYPSAVVAQNSHDYRPLGLGYANLGALLMAEGLAYDSPEGRGVTACVTALISGLAYLTSAEIARDCGGPFPRWAENRETMLAVVSKHLEFAETLAEDHALYLADAVVPERWQSVAREARRLWEDALRIGKKYGFRNAQLTVIAPTGTIGFMMDCDTTGIESDTYLRKRKRLAGGGDLFLTNGSVGAGLKALGYSDQACEYILTNMRNLDETKDDMTSCGLRPEHLPVFATAFGKNHLRPEAHVLMVAAAQPFISGAISKTTNLPSTATREDVSRVYRLAAERGLKAIALYVDGSKGSQPINAAGAKEEKKDKALQWGDRRKLPHERRSTTRKLELGGHDFYFHVGLFEDGTAGELFACAAKEGSVVSGLMDLFGTTFSLALQHGCPLETLLDKIRGTRFEPAGWTGDPEFPQASSFADFLAQWLSKRATEGWPVKGVSSSVARVEAAVGSTPNLSGKLCRGCSDPMIQDGLCWKCVSCGKSEGGCGG